MRNDIFFLLIFSIFFSTNASEIDKGEIRYSQPFDVSDLEYHCNSINMGKSYYLLVPSKYRSDNMRIIGTHWFHPEGERIVTIDFVDSLLNSGLENRVLTTIQMEEPIKEEDLSFYKNYSSCELLRSVFTVEGYLKNHIDIWLNKRNIIAALIQRNYRISVSDYEGQIVIGLGEEDCFAH